MAQGKEKPTLSSATVSVISCAIIVCAVQIRNRWNRYLSLTNKTTNSSEQLRPLRPFSWLNNGYVCVSAYVKAKQLSILLLFEASITKCHELLWSLYTHGRDITLSITVS